MTETEARSPEKASDQQKPHIKWSDSYTKAHLAIEALAAILPSQPPYLSTSETPAASLLCDPDVAAQISDLLRRPDSGAANDNLCAWLYDTFQSSEPDLHLVVLRFVPVLAGVYLARASLNKPLAGFESVFLAIYAYETASRNGQAITISIPDLAHSSIYHETKQTAKKCSTELHLGVISPSLEPYGTVRATRRARIVGVALELYYSKISDIPDGSKLELCEFCMFRCGETSDKGKILLPWELMQPVFRILGHCLMGPAKNEELSTAALSACRCLYERAMHDLNPKAILAAGSLVRLGELAAESDAVVDYTEIPMGNIITI